MRDQGGELGRRQSCSVLRASWATKFCATAAGRWRQDGKGLIRARVVLSQDWLAQCAEDCGDQGTRHDAAGHEGLQGSSSGRAKAKSAARDLLWLLATKSDPASRNREKC